MPMKNIGHAALAAGAVFYTAPAADANAGRPDGIATVLGIQVLNRTASSGTISISWLDASNANADNPLTFNLTIPAYTSINILDAFKLPLEPGDALRAQASANNVFAITGAVSED